MQDFIKDAQELLVELGRVSAEKRKLLLASLKGMVLATELQEQKEEKKGA